MSAGPRLGLGVLLDALPEAVQVREIAVELAVVLVETGGGAHDDAAARRRLQTLDDLADADPLLAFDLARDAGVLRPRQEHQVTSRQRIERGERRRLVGELLLDDLDQDLVAGLEDVLDAAAAFSPFSPLSPAPLPPLRSSPGRLRKQISSRGRKASRSAPMSTKAASIAGMDAPDDAFVDVPLQVLPAEGFDLEGLELAVVNDPDAALLRVGDVDEHDLGHTGLEPPPHRYPRRPITRWCLAANESSLHENSGISASWCGHRTKRFLHELQAVVAPEHLIVDEERRRAECASCDCFVGIGLEALLDSPPPRRARPDADRPSHAALATAARDLAITDVLVVRPIRFHDGVVVRGEGSLLERRDGRSKRADRVHREDARHVEAATRSADPAPDVVDHVRRLGRDRRRHAVAGRLEDEAEHHRLEDRARPRGGSPGASISRWAK